MAQRCIADQSRRNDLEGDIAPEARIAAPVDLAHTADAEQRLNLVRAKQVARLEGAPPDDAAQRRRRAQQIEHFTPELGIRAAFQNEPFSIRFREIRGVREQRLRAFPVRSVHRSACRRRPSQNLAAATSRRTVAGDRPLMVATSASVKPPK